VITGELLQGMIQCKVPRLDPGKAYVSISFDSEHFSEVSLPLKISAEPWDPDTVIGGLLLCAATLGIGLAILKKMRSKGVPKFNDHDSLVSKVAASRGFL
jgi:hypothetical protein